jgi:DNA repair protein RadC
MDYDLGTIKMHTEIQETQDKIESLNDVTAKYSALGEKQKEHVYAIFLTNSNEEIGNKLIGLGGLNSAPVDIQDVVRTAILVKAGAVILIHNHPSGQPQPTTGDIKNTEKIHNLLDQLGITLLDHIIITHSNSHSMKQHGNGPFQ